MSLKDADCPQYFSLDFLCFPYIFIIWPIKAYICTVHGSCDIADYGVTLPQTFWNHDDLLLDI